MSKIKRIEVTNFKAIKHLEADFNGCTAIITGKNGSGKSSFIKGLTDRLRGIKPDVIVKQGESEGNFKMELTTGEKFEWSFDNVSKGGERLSFYTSDNIKVGITKDIATKYFPAVFDIDTFLKASGAEQNKMLQKLVGVDFTSLDAQYKSAYDDRTFENKKLKDAKVLLDPINERLETKEVDVLSIQTEIAGMDNHNERFNGVKKGIDEKAKTITENETNIKNLEKQIVALKAKNKDLQKDIDAGTKWMAEDKNKLKDDDYSFALNKKLQDAVDLNNKIIKNNKAIEQKKVVDALEITSEKADKRVKDILQQKDDVIKNSKLPDGFGFIDGGITLDGLPFTREQISSSAIYIAALKLAAMNIGQVKALHFDASYLDKINLAEIEKWAESQDLQLLIERPDFDGGEIEYKLIES